MEICPKDLVIRVGSSNRTSGGQIIPIQECVPHKDFNFWQAVYDIGVIKLRSPVKLNENVTVLELAKNHIPIGKKVMISGWGLVKVRRNLRFVKSKCLLEKFRLFSVIEQLFE